MKIDLNFTMNYCRRWGLAEAVREVIQNARDVEIEGGSFTVEHNGINTLTVTSTGQTMSSSALVFGASNKTSDHRTIGQFGDGLKVALGVFLRLHCTVKIHTGREIWTPCVIERDGVDLVGVLTRSVPVQHHRERVVFTIDGVTPTDWLEWSKWFLFLVPAKDTVSTPYGTLLKDRPGLVFCKGIYVCRIEGLRYGYDLPSLTLNRDRQVADQWEVQNHVWEVWISAVEAKPEYRVDMLDLVSDFDQTDMHIVPTMARTINTQVLKSLAVAFRDRHGDAIPVATSGEATVAGQNGWRGVVTPVSLRNLLEAGGVMSLRERIASRKEDVLQRFTENDLTSREIDVLQGAINVLSPALEERKEEMPVIEVVNFADPTRLGVYSVSSDRVLLARQVLAHRHKVLGVLAHEIAHRQGGDGDALHREAIEDILGRALAHMMI